LHLQKIFAHLRDVPTPTGAWCTRKSRSDAVYALPFIFSVVGSAALLWSQLASAQGGAVRATLLSTCTPCGRQAVTLCAR
jgi:hypothetical protein